MPTAGPLIPEPRCYQISIAKSPGFVELI